MALLVGLAGTPVAERLGLTTGGVEIQIDAEPAVLAAIAAEVSEEHDEVEVLADSTGLRVVGGERFEALAAVRESARARNAELGTFTLLSPLSGLADALRSGDPERLARVFALLAFPLPLVLIALGARQRRRLLARRAPPAPAGNPWLIGAGAGLLALGLAMALELGLSDLGLEPREQPLIVELVDQGGAAWVSLFLLGVVLAPLGEELFFRGFAFERLAEAGPTWLAYAASSLLFAGVHLNPSAFPLYLMLGLVLAWSLRAADSIVAPVVAHALYNGSALVIAILAASGEGGE